MVQKEGGGTWVRGGGVTNGEWKTRRADKVTKRNKTPQKSL
jgi:hypothetical protein